MKKIGLLLLLILILSGCTSEKKILLINTDGNNQSDTNIGFLDLNDTPNSYVGQAGKFPKVNPTEDGLIFSDANGGSGSDTNCGVSGSCPNVLYKNTDFNAEDINAQSLTLQQPGGQKFIYSTTTGKVLEVPLPIACTEIFGVAGLPQTGLEFCASPWTAIAFRIIATPIFLFFEGGTNQGAFYQAPQPAPLTNPPILGGVTQWSTFIDGNRLMCYHNATIGWKECGTFQSQYSPDFLFQTGVFNNTTDKNQLRFLGAVDFNATIDVNGQGNFTQNLSTDQNLIVDGNINLSSTSKINGTFLSAIALNGLSCDNACNQYDVNTGTNYSCIDAFQSAVGTPHVLCSSTTLNKNCLCKN